MNSMEDIEEGECSDSDSNGEYTPQVPQEPEAKPLPLSNSSRASAGCSDLDSEVLVSGGELGKDDCPVATDGGGQDCSSRYKMKRAADDVIDLTNEEDSPVKKRPNNQEFKFNFNSNKQESHNKRQDFVEKTKQDKKNGGGKQKKGKKFGRDGGFEDSQGFGYSDPFAPYTGKRQGGFGPNNRGQGFNMGGGQNFNMRGGQDFNMRGPSRGFDTNNGGRPSRGFDPNNGFHSMDFGRNPMNSVGSHSGFDPGRRGSSNDFSDGDYHGIGKSFQDFPADDVFSHPSETFRVKLLPDPEDFVPLTEVLTKFIDPQMAISGAGKWTALTQSVVNKFNMSQQPKQMLMQKILLWKEMYRALRTEFDCGICVFGSTFNGFGGSGSDLDMCLFPHEINMMMNSKGTLNLARRVMRKECRNFIKGDIELVPAKIPILKFFDAEGSLEVDLSVNNPTSIRNTHLLYCYSQLDYRVRPMVLAVKLWAKSHDINEARLMTLSSYTLTLMVIHYLQSGVRPVVLPCLQQMFPHVFNSDSDIFRLSYHPTDLPDFQSANDQSIGELFAGFINYYASEFNPERDVGSVRTGQILRHEDCLKYAKLNKLSPGQWNAKLHMEEPFDRTNAARSVINAGKWKDVEEVFLSTQKKLDRLGKKAELVDLMAKERGSRDSR